MQYEKQVRNTLVFSTLCGTVTIIKYNKPLYVISYSFLNMLLEKKNSIFPQISSAWKQVKLH